MRRLKYYLIILSIAQSSKTKGMIKMNIINKQVWYASLSPSELKALNDGNDVKMVIDGLSIVLRPRPTFPGPE